MSLSKRYITALQQPDMVEDVAQQRAIQKLEALSHAISTEKRRWISAFPQWLPPFNKPAEQPLSGLYIWGGVGRGKTWLMNLFYEELAIEEKYRVHFHHFMLDIHERLSLLNREKSRNRKNPLQSIAGELAGKYSVLCIDEFIVTNITDAMILSELLDALFKRRVYLVATSNRIPDDLYLNGLQRERFLPAIELIKNRMDVFHLDSGVDHRTSLLEQADVYYCPADDNTPHTLLQRMQELAITPLIRSKTLNIHNREIKTIYCSEEIAWFDFETLCSAPRAAQDYIELARQFNTLIITGIPIMDEHSDDKSRRFIYLIDELYDRNVKLIASAEAQPEDLYHGNMLEFAFHRTSSRLIEMRSHQYLSKQHKPF
jgi:cell division protein ZapE